MHVAELQRVGSHRLRQLFFVVVVLVVGLLAFVWARQDRMPSTLHPDGPGQANDGRPAWLCRFSCAKPDKHAPEATSGTPSACQHAKEGLDWRVGCRAALWPMHVLYASCILRGACHRTTDLCCMQSQTRRGLWNGNNNAAHNSSADESREGVTAKRIGLSAVGRVWNAQGSFF